MITFKHSGNFDNTDKFFKKVTTSSYVTMLNNYGREGVRALASVTPIDSGKTAESWSYSFTISRKGGIRISWMNSNIVNGVPIVILLQYGHATTNGGYIRGRDFINPAIQPIFDKIASDLWREVTK